MPRRQALLLFLLFVGSGASALIYELVWFQWLGLVIGSSALSLGILLATFMGGMGLGALALPRFVSARHHPLRVYAVLELGIAGFGVLLQFGLPWLSRSWPGVEGAGLSTVAVRAAVAGLCLLPPTLLMGATLPAIARLVTASRAGLARLGWFYGGNIAGAAFGTLLAGFYLLPRFDAGAATAVAVGVNVAVAALAAALARAAPYRPPGTSLPGTSLPGTSEPGTSVPGTAESGTAEPGTPAPGAADRPGGRGVVAPLAAVTLLSGATALACQVIWTRQLALFVGATVYGFALILAVFLVGLGVGTTLGAALGRRLSRPGSALALCQALLCLAIAWGAWSVTRQLPYWPVNESLRLPADLFRTAWALLPATLLWGASFPLALAAMARPGDDPSARDAGRPVGALYAANTLGAILGALGAGYFLVPGVGSQLTQQVLVIGAAAAAGLALWAAGPRAVTGLALAGFAGVVALVSVRLVPPIPAQVIAAGHYLPDWGRGVDVIYAEEGVTASVAVSREPNGALTYHNSGKVQASSYPRDMRLQRMLGHLTTLLPAQREDFLVIGLGAGVTAGAMAADAAVGRITVAEIEPLVAQVAGEWFAPWNGGVVDHPRVDLRVEDGRHYLQATRRRFDGITSDPLDPWTRGSAALYTEEFWRLARSRLKPGGVVTAWGQLYESTEDSARSVIGTFMRVFPNSAVFANTVDGEGYDMVLVGLADGDTIDLDRLIARYRASAPIRDSLASVGFESPFDLLSTYAGRPSDLAPWLAEAPINRDRDMRLQYLAGRGSRRYDQAVIFDRMLAGGVAWPADLFSGETSDLATLERLIRERQGRVH